MGELDSAIDSFFTALDEAGMGDRAIILTASEFGRRPRDNGGGTDHGTAAAHILIGSAVAGGRYVRRVTVAEPARSDRQPDPRRRLPIRLRNRAGRMARGRCRRRARSDVRTPSDLLEAQGSAQEFRSTPHDQRNEWVGHRVLAGRDPRADLERGLLPGGDLAGGIPSKRGQRHHGRAPRRLRPRAHRREQDPHQGSEQSGGGSTWRRRSFDPARTARARPHHR